LHLRTHTVKLFQAGKQEEREEFTARRGKINAEKINKRRQRGEQEGGERGEREREGGERKRNEREDRVRSLQCSQLICMI
jgi:hypothetical protein